MGRQELVVSGSLKGGARDDLVNKGEDGTGEECVSNGDRDDNDEDCTVDVHD